MNVIGSIIIFSMSSDTIYISDRKQGKIKKIDLRTYKITTIIEGLVRVTGIAVGKFIII